MFTNGTGNYPDIEAALARLEEEDPPAHVRAQRLAALHVEMAQASHTALEDIQRQLGALQQHVDEQFAVMQTTQEAGSAQARRSVQEMQRGVEARVSQVEYELAHLRQELPKLGQRVTVGQYMVAVLGGALVGTLMLVALWLALGQAMQVRVIPQPAGQP